MDYEDITYDILESEEPVTLIIMYDLQKTDRKQAAKAFRMYEEMTNDQSTMSNGLAPVYFLTGSGEDEIEELAEEFGWNEETTARAFCYTDPVTLKTIVRANPGLIVIQNGTILAKKNLRQL